MRIVRKLKDFFLNLPSKNLNIKIRVCNINICLKQNFRNLPNYYETHLKILGNRMVLRGKFHTDRPHQLEASIRKFSRYCNLTPQILAPQFRKDVKIYLPLGGSKFRFIILFLFSKMTNKSAVTINYRTPTCFDTIVSSSGSSYSVPFQVT